ncbi:hypothetical protein HETIRDRAFT_457014 [Heterobasidion irregulare TC 32-1]|uniref:Uncharacterized protein n=1 Tax=Heterobasidion irregulare (strain TC 32-1) TaxID=747525 RepID=W4KNL9_HETIT|nr:uncharacterized protein HETIRDRAFT_457014 [Heterobasidion irregulare TC 32-1]ETW87433.1 hypothetical protein HETIRDRAFT_457014 [Heterobasidion irregulare TC 32-1]
MAQSPAQSNTPSGSDPAFFPRREFIRDDRIPSTFSILAISGSACIRVYNFLPPLISALRTFLDRDHLVTAFREDAIQNFCEFCLEGKPWASPKSTFTEKLLVDILALLYQNGFVFLSTIDYGREQDDRIAMAFSKPHTSPPTHSSSSSPRPSSTFSRGSSATLNRPLKVPFAISFPNATTLRVISPPLHSTPAILQTVRAAWPRGVVSEKKIRDTVFEFKLKGYKWFQEDTFATDSLRQVLALLGSLDSYGFTLLCSISIANRSRVKDLWIFTGISHGPSPDTSSSKTDLLKENGHVHQPSPLSMHHAVLRKGAPRAQVPVSVGVSIDSQENIPAMPGPSFPRTENDLVRLPLPSTVSSDIDMTGIGAGGFRLSGRRDERYPLGSGPTVLYTAGPPNPYFPSVTDYAAEPTSSPGASALAPSSPHVAAEPENLHPTAQSAPIPPRTLPRPPILATRPNLSLQSSGSTTTPPLLGPGAFRDSAFSSSTGQTYDIPITWTGEEQEKATFKEQVTPELQLPGGWASPVEEKQGEQAELKVHPSMGAHGRGNGNLPELRLGKDKIPFTQVVKVAEPELVQPEVDRKSEMALLGELPRPQRRQRSASEQGERLKERPKGDGWVLVNIGPTGNSPASPMPPSRTTTSPSLPARVRSASDPSLLHLTSPTRLTSPISGNAKANTGASRTGTHPSTMSPAAKSIVIIDAMEARKPNGHAPGGMASAQPSAESPSSLRRVFSLNRQKPSGKTHRRTTSSTLSPSAANSKPRSGQEEGENKKRVGLIERWRRLGTTEASRAARRVSVDGA